MAKTNRLIDIKQNGSLILPECREIDFNGLDYVITVDGPNESLVHKLNTVTMQNKVLPLIIALG